MTTFTPDEQVVRDFLAPLSTIEPVRRPAGGAPEPGPRRHHLRYAAIAVAAVLLVAVIAVIAHPRTSEKPAKHHVDTGIFSKTHGWITLGGQQIIALNPANPTQTRVLSRSPGNPIAWSSDGSQLLTSGPHGFAVLHADGHWTRLIGSSASGGSFTPDGSHVIYASRGSIWSAAADGGERTAIARGRIGRVYDMPGDTGDQLSPDGGTLAYRPGWTTPQSISIALMDSDGSHQRRIVSYPQVVTLMGQTDWRHSDINDISALAWRGNIGGPVFIALNQRATRCAVFTVNRDGNDLRRWGPPRFCPLRASLSPDGRRLAFTAAIPGHRAGIVITDDNGRVTKTIPLSHQESHLALAWQP